MLTVHPVVLTIKKMKTADTDCMVLSRCELQCFTTKAMVLRVMRHLLLAK
ncbi:uncharacterized protein PHALS_03100 [Plasmopara halstedii]|uniref:Uncharacterized protein n=1 Tax=Plasmopara halstedii TaxID=4781 RepID=A0A0P1A8G3_PLAHL|nr:uncharacterized protein PHALS_03100 [Plasmopara halstedii]CEG36552.1 hypothetical protein PHALS_03100 [Plasmopara halstedii]|eukprot:XP_024572921.1 hypothetical protein PHALS_03100 [Plasmopara halstedii]